MSDSRSRLPTDRIGKTHSAKIGKTKLYITTGEYHDGTLGEIFLAVDKQGAELRVYDLLAISISIGLQHGIPVAKYIEHLKGQKMEPAGVTSNPDIPIAQSIGDYLARWLEITYPERLPVDVLGEA
ncbi:hypothetical protein [Candidatus Magnetobacterium casense]|uniref:ribonucleoside-diphosphate reductase n=1 Tax=Candidatus Magnetobacterium casense TaxID=1455061 RepID=A0ABS6RWL2_9BACT|nr:hypothetical protein [Candidatus Magnetobacterium casensis]MBV6340976.1 hypothetical protein [Candidatus Magnetobacterium casensis]